MISASSWPRFSPGSTTINHNRGLIVRRLGVDLAAYRHLSLFFCARGGFDDRVDSGPRDRNCYDHIRRLPCRHVACNKIKSCGIIVPHGISGRTGRG